MDSWLLSSKHRVANAASGVASQREAPLSSRKRLRPEKNTAGEWVLHRAAWGVKALKAFPRWVRRAPLKAKALIVVLLLFGVINLFYRPSMNQISSAFSNDLKGTAAFLVAALTVLGGLAKYFDTQHRERLDRAGAELTGLWNGIASRDPDARAASIAGLQPFLTPDKSEHHARVAAALAYTGRLNNRPSRHGRRGDDSEIEARRPPLNNKPPSANGPGGQQSDKAATLDTKLVSGKDGRDVATSTFQGVLKVARESISPEVLRAISWRGVNLCGADLSRRGTELLRPNFKGIDFRNAQLKQCDFRGCNLSHADFTNSILTDSKFDDAILSEAKFGWADLTGASFRNARLNEADLRNAKILGADFFEAKLIGIKTWQWPDTNWADAQNWREAYFDVDGKNRPTKEGETKRKLCEQYGAVLGPESEHVLMLLWEYPPFAVGGLWTACYHLLQHLRHVGQKITLFVPWEKKILDRSMLGFEYDVVALGIRRPPGEAYSTFSGSYSYPFCRSLQSMVEDFARRAVEHLETDLNKREPNLKDVSVVHAHDWLTFKAADEIRNRIGLPWVAHFHSTAYDRRGAMEDSEITEIESLARLSAQSVVAVSESLRGLLKRTYLKDAPSKDVRVIPDCLYRFLPGAPPFVDRVGSYQPKRVIFMGRLSKQKGPTHFVEIANRLEEECIRSRARILWERRGGGDSSEWQKDNDWCEAKGEQQAQHPIRFDMYGSGDLNIETAAGINRLRRHSLPVTANTKFSQVQRADVNGAGEWWGGRPLTRRERRAIAQAISNGTVRCQAEALQLAKPYTHLITIEDPRSEGPRDEIARHYLVATADLPAYDSIRDPFVILRGGVKWKDRLNVFEGASAMVVPSISEPFGLVVLEAMQSGVPVVYPYECGAAEVVREAAEKVFHGCHDEWKSKEWLKEMQFRKVDAETVDAKEIAEKVSKILTDRVRWEGVVRAQIEVVSWYVKQASERTIEPLQKVWREGVPLIPVPYYACCGDSVSGIGSSRV